MAKNLSKRDRERKEVQSTNFKNNWAIAIKTVENPNAAEIIQETEKEIEEKGEMLFPFLKKYVTKIHKAKIPVE